MNIPKFLGPLFAPLVVGALFLCPGDAAAAEVMCSNDLGECTVSNNGQSFFSCDCVEAGGTGGSGGDEYDGLSEAELLEVCEDLLSFCDLPGGDGDGDTEGTSTGTGGDTTTGDPTEGWETDTEGWETDTEGWETEGDTEGTSTGSSGGGGTGDGDGDGETGETDTGDPTTGDDSDTGNNSSTGDTDTDGETDTGAAEGGDSDGETEGDSGDYPGDGDGESEGDTDSDSEGETGEAEGGDSGGADEEAGGCSVVPNNPGIGFVALSMLALFGLRRREESQA